MYKNKNPHFICIGPTKTGTSWLYVSLKKLPQVEMPRAKELKYYWGNGNPRRTFINLPPGLIERLLGAISYPRRKKYFRRVVNKYISGHDKLALDSILWDLKYIFLPQTFKWYTSLFPKEKISGDIDGGYIFFDQSTISLIKQHLPDVRIILMLRDPMQKYWSDLRMLYYHIRDVDLGSKSEDEMVHEFRKILHDRPRYSDIVELWSSNFSEDQFFIGYFDDLQKNPRDYFNRICAFLDLEVPDLEIEGLERVAFGGTPFDIPAAVERAGHEVLIPDLERLTDLVDSGYPGEWLKSMTDRRDFLNKNAE